MRVRNKPKNLRQDDILDSTSSTSITRPASPKSVSELLAIINTIKGTGWTDENLAALQSAVTAMKGSGWAGESLSELKATVDYILASQELDMGVEFTEMPATVTGTRTLSNVGKTFRVNAGSMNTDPYPLTDVRYQFPYNRMRTAKISTTGVVAAYIDEPGFSAAEGNAMVWLPKTYYRKTSVYDIEFSAYQRPGYTIYPLFWDYTNEVERDGVWVSALPASDGTTVLKSEPDSFIAHSKLMYGATGFRGLAQAIGTGWGIGDLALRDYLKDLFLVAAASWNSQAAVGKGCEAMRRSADDKVVLATSSRNDIIVTTTTAALYNVGEWISLGTAVDNSTRFHSRAITAIKDAGKLDLTATVDADTVTVNGTTYTKVASGPGTGEFVNAAGLVAILDAIEGMDAIAASEVITLVCDSTLTVTFSGENTTYTAYKSVVVGGAAFNAVLNDVMWHCAQVVTEAMLLAMGNESGYIGTNGRTPVSFFGIWDLWGNIWQWVDGAFKSDSDFYYTFDPQYYDAIINTIPATLGDYTKHATPLPTSNGYLGEMEGVPAVPKTLTGGSDVTGCCDYFYQNTGYRGLRVGGGWNNDASSPGLFSWYVDSAPGPTYVSVGARLLFRP